MRSFRRPEKETRPPVLELRGTWALEATLRERKAFAWDGEGQERGENFQKRMGSHCVKYSREKA